jgi:hypothetical protein
MSRFGAISLLGAGASADAGYPTAGVFLDKFRERLVEDRSRSEYLPFFDTHLKTFRDYRHQVGELIVPGKSDEQDKTRLFSGGSLVYNTDRGMVFTDSSPERRSNPDPDKIQEIYLEDFFAFWDEIYQRPIIDISWNEVSQLSNQDIHVRRHFLRRLREFAAELTYDLLAPRNHSEINYLASLLNLRGPVNHKSIICTLNFDLVVEQLALLENLKVIDGFDRLEYVPHPTSWFGQLVDSWNDIIDTFETYHGFNDVKSNEHHLELLKLHGSLGWFTIDEGNGEVGWSDILREKIRLLTFRYSFADLINSADPIEKFSGKNGHLCKSGRHLTGKMGAIWIRPALIFAQAKKFFPHKHTLDYFQRFSQWMENAKYLVVIGYGWQDTHINDMVLENVSRGLEIININKDPFSENLVALIVNKYPTTHKGILQRFYCIGGGAKKVLHIGVGETPSGGEHPFSFNKLEDGNLPEVFLLANHLESNV